MNNILELLMKSAEKLPNMDLSFNGGGGYVPESELMRAIMLRMIEDLKGPPGEIRDDALAFMLGDEDGDNENEDEYVFSFTAICRHFRFDPKSTRLAILAAIDEGRRISTRRRAA